MDPEGAAHLSRRSLLAGTGLTALPRAADASSGRPKVIDVHEHLSHHSRADWQESDRRFIDNCEKLGIDQVWCSILTPRRPATPDGFRECNQWVYDAMRRFPGRVSGYAFVNPGFVPEALSEVRRCVEDRGFIGIKLYNDYLVSEPVACPLIELSIELRVPILHHAGHPSWLDHPQPRISDGAAFAEVAQRYPEAAIICAHICGGGDWEWEIKALRNAPSIYLDTSGSVADEGTVEMAVQVLGADRVLFACDTSLTASVGRMRSANLTQPDKEKIMGLNAQRILDRRGK